MIEIFSRRRSNFFSSIQKVTFLNVGKLLNLGRLKQMRVFLNCLTWDLVSEIAVDLTNIGRSAYFRNERWSHLSSCELFPINVSKEGVCLDLVDVKPFLWVSLEKSF